MDKTTLNIFKDYSPLCCRCGELATRELIASAGSSMWWVTCGSFVFFATVSNTWIEEDILADQAVVRWERILRSGIGIGPFLGPVKARLKTKEEGPFYCDLHTSATISQGSFSPRLVDLPTARLIREVQAIESEGPSVLERVLSDVQ
jgi:hypothetical protein